MWFLHMEGNKTDINIIDVSTGERILSDLENTLDIEYPNLFPYGIYDVEILERDENLISINIEHEDINGDTVNTTLNIKKEGL